MLVFTEHSGAHCIHAWGDSSTMEGGEEGWGRGEGTPGQGRRGGQRGRARPVCVMTSGIFPLNLPQLSLLETPECGAMKTGGVKSSRQPIHWCVALTTFWESLFKEVEAQGLEIRLKALESKYPKMSTFLIWKVRALKVVGSAGRREKHSRVEQLFSWRPAPRISHGVRKPSALRL